MTNEEYAALDDISKMKFLRDGLCFDGFVQIGDKILRESTIPKELMPPITEDERDAARYFGRKVKGIHDAEQGKRSPADDDFWYKPKPGDPPHYGIKHFLPPDAPPVIIGVPADWPIPEENPDPTGLLMRASVEKAIERAAKAGCEVWDARQTRSKYYDKTWHDVARAVILAYLGRSLEDNADRPLVGRVCVGSDPGAVGGGDAVTGGYS